MATDTFSLRERKAAQIKVGLAFAVRDRLTRSTLEDITVRDLCGDTQISDATFFNYYKRKSDIFLYLTQLITLELVACARQRPAGPTAFERLQAFFAETADQMASHPWVMQEVMANQILMREPPIFAAVTDVERMIAFPTLDTSGIPTPLTVVDIFGEQIAAAIEQGELPAATSPEFASIALFSIYFGVAMALEWAPIESVGPMYDQQLRTPMGRAASHFLIPQPPEVDHV